jgi:hypothetical protein
MEHQKLWIRWRRITNVTETTSFFRAHIIMHDLLFTLCSIIAAIDSVFFDLWCYMTGAEQRCQ